MSLEQRRAVYNVDGQALTFVKAESYKGPLLVNTFGAYTLELRFSREWKEFDRIALYLQAAGAAGITLDLTDPLNAQKLSETDTQVIYLVNVPSQILKSIGQITVGVTGYKSQDTSFRFPTTLDSSFKVTQSTPNMEAEVLPQQVSAVEKIFLQLYSNLSGVVSNEQIVAAFNKAVQDGLIDISAQQLNQITELINSLDETKENRKPYIYNADKLKVIRTKPTFDTIVIGDSIAGGSGASKPENGFIRQINSRMERISGGSFHSMSYAYNHGFDNAKKWTQENDGILLKLISTSDPTLTLTDMNKSQPWDIPSTDRKVVVVYSKRPGAGSFKVTVDTTDVETVSCNGEKADGVLTQEYTVAAQKVLTITPVGDGPVYINAFIEDIVTDKDYYKLDNISEGGRQAQQYNTDQIDTMLTFVPYDLLIWEVFANDYGLGTYEGYEPIARHALSKARELGKDILIPIACRSDSIKTESWINTFNKFKKLQYDLAKEFDACIIDFDTMFGESYDTANSNGLMTDGIHPSDKGHTLMADEVCRILFNEKSSNLNRGDYIYTNDSRHPQYQHIVNKDNTYYTGDIIFDNLKINGVDSNGAAGNVLYAMPSVRKYTTAQFPKKCVKGTVSSAIDNDQLYVNTANTEDTASWLPALAVPCLPIVTALPLTNGYAEKRDLGKVIILNTDNVFSIHACVFDSSLSKYVWKKVADLV